jgi:hypothetical protein
MSSINTADFIPYFTEGVIQGFVNVFPSVDTFSTKVDLDVPLGGVIRVPFSNPATSSLSFDYATGYATDTELVTSKNVTVNQLKYRKYSMSDTDFQKINPDSIAGIAMVEGAKLASDVLSDVLSLATTASFNYANYIGGAWSGSAAGNDLLTLQNYIINNANVTNNYSFGGLVAQQGIVPSYYSFKPSLANVISSNIQGFACINSAILFANSYHQPSPVAGTTPGLLTQRASDPKSGLTIGIRSYYDPKFATTHFICDCLYGYSVGNSAAGIVIRSV